jgi:hypothetical protein
MSNVLAHIRVTETHGIRRFLYPLSANVLLPPEVLWTNERKQIRLLTSDGQPVPFQKGPLDGTSGKIGVGEGVLDFRFAVFLAPMEHREFQVVLGGPRADLEDPLQLHIPEEGALLSRTPTDVTRSIQKQLRTALNANGQVAEVIYDGVSHLLGASRVTLPSGEIASSEKKWDFGTLSAWTQDMTHYANHTVVTSRAEITACKSWATVTQTRSSMASGEEVTFTLPLAVTSPTLTCDFGVGGYVFGKLQASTVEEIVWRTQFTDDGMALWTVATAGRVDYVGEALSEDFLSQRWFHLIDSDKALAVAITDVPSECAEMTVTLRANGDVIVAFRLGDVAQNTAVKFGVCYHFLNDVPAIAAATNPQSILLPPTVEVLAT